MPPRRRLHQSTPPDRPAKPRAEQLALFPETVNVRPLDARAVAGAGTRVRGVWLVRYEREPAPHRVFADRHGWYCDEHGPGCRAAVAARAAADPKGDDAPRPQSHTESRSKLRRR